MLAHLSRNWWFFALRGVVAILFGLAAMVWPGATLFVLVMLFAAWALADGFLAVLAAIANRREERLWWILLEGIAGIAVAILAVAAPQATTLSLLYVIAAWAIVTGVLEILTAIELRRKIANEWSLILGGVASVIVGVLLILFPGAGALGLIKT